MTYFKASNSDLRKCYLDSNNTTIKSYSTYSRISKGETDKKKSSMVPICLKLFTVLFLGILCFLSGFLFKEENLQISVSKFNKDHLRVLAEKESNNVNNLVYLDKPFKQFEGYFIELISSLLKNMHRFWENMCYNNSVRLSQFGRIWEQEKFNYWFDKVHKDTNNICDKISEECRIFKKSYPSDKEYSAFFKKKKKELNKFEKKQFKWLFSYIDVCEKEWYYIKSLRNNPNICPLRCLLKKEKNYEILKNEQNK